MFSITIIALLILALISMIATWVMYRRRQQRLYNLLIYPYAIYFFFMLIMGNESLDIYINQQLFTVSLAFFAIYSSLTLLILSKMSE